MLEIQVLILFDFHMYHKIAQIQFFILIGHKPNNSGTVVEDSNQENVFELECLHLNVSNRFMIVLHYM